MWGGVNLEGSQFTHFREDKLALMTMIKTSSSGSGPKELVR